MKISGKLSAIVLGVEADADIKIAGKPFIDLLWDMFDGNEPDKISKVKSSDGDILTGCATVIVGG